MQYIFFIRYILPSKAEKSQWVQTVDAQHQQDWGPGGAMEWLPSQGAVSMGSSVLEVLWLVTQSHLTLKTPWTGARQAPLSMGLPRQEHWSGLPFPSPGDLSDSSKGQTLSPALAGRFFTTDPPGKPSVIKTWVQILPLPIPSWFLFSNEDILTCFAVIILFTVKIIKCDPIKHLTYVRGLNHTSFLLP